MNLITLKWLYFLYLAVRFRRLLLPPAAMPTKRIDFTLISFDSLVKQTLINFTSGPRSLFA